MVVIGLNLFKSYGNWIYSGNLSTHLTYLLLSIQEDFVLWTQDEPDIHWRALWKWTLSPSKVCRIYPYDITNIRIQHSSINVRMVFSLSLSLSLYNYIIYNYVTYGINIGKLCFCDYNSTLFCLFVGLLHNYFTNPFIHVLSFLRKIFK